MRRAICHGWGGRLIAAGAFVLLFISPIASHATPIIFRIFNLGESAAYVVRRNASTLSTESTSSVGVFAERVDAVPGDQIVLAPNVDLAPPVPPSLASVSAAGPGCAHVAWEPSSDPYVVGYRISYGALSVEQDQSTQYQYSHEVGAVGSFDACSLSGGTYYFAIQAINYAGQSSGYSQERSVHLTTTAVLISRFDAHAAGRSVQLSWSVETDENITGFNIYRRTEGGDQRLLLDAPLASSATSYVDKDVQNGTHYTYVLAALRDDGSEIRSVPASATTPSLALALEPNAPNPFRETTRIPFTLDTDSHVVVRVYDVRGALVTTLLDGPLAQGSHDVSWDGADANGRRVASGAYFYTLSAGQRMQSRKMLLVR
ncbi:MAG TPA: FlgD immunoglobulin-like domain containing protein [Candidatus Krumholzibacteria bacterium]|nr:FlgD immunoglobulin-like domain containing protein [Candidatus Krumholzibacteria bacterium]